MNHDASLVGSAHLTDIGSPDAKTEAISIGFPVPPVAPPKVDYVRRTKVDSLDDLDNEVPDEPYRFQLRGQEFAMISPKDADWVDISAAAENPRLLVHILMSDDDRGRFLALGKVRVRVLQGLMERYQNHFGVGGPGESAGSARS